jgi:hypothetical protein
MPRHVMIDLETLGTGKEATILQIGACDFDPEVGVGAGRFMRHVSMESNFALNRTVDPGAFLFWLDQPRAAQQRIVQGQKTAMHLATALSELIEFCQHASGRRSMGSRPEKPAGVWSHGAGFDVVILETAYAACGIDPPWTYRDARDTRTLWALSRTHGRGEPEALVEGNEMEHDALADAVWQAQVTCAVWQSLGRVQP